MPAGRPSSYNQDIAQEVCSRIVEGESLRSICRDPSMPGLKTIFDWFPKHPEFTQQYEKAMAQRADTCLEDMFEIADNATSENANVARLQVDVRKWAASKLKPKKYGDSMLNKLADSDGNKLELSISHAKLISDVPDPE